MDYYRCENPDCGFIAEDEPDVCPRCGNLYESAACDCYCPHCLTDSRRFVRFPLREPSY